MKQSDINEVWVAFRSNPFERITGVKGVLAGVFSSEERAVGWIRAQKEGCWLESCELDAEHDDETMS